MSYLQTVESEVLIIVSKPEFNLICSKIPKVLERLLSAVDLFQEHEQAVLMHWKKINWVEFEERGNNADTIALSNYLFEIGAEKYFIINLIGEDSRYNVYRGTYREENPFQSKVIRNIQIENPGSNISYTEYVKNNSL